MMLKYGGTKNNQNRSVWNDIGGGDNRVPVMKMVKKIKHNVYMRTHMATCQILFELLPSCDSSQENEYEEIRVHSSRKKVELWEE